MLAMDVRGGRTERWYEICIMSSVDCITEEALYVGVNALGPAVTSAKVTRNICICVCIYAGGYESGGCTGGGGGCDGGCGGRGGCSGDGGGCGVSYGGGYDGGRKSESWESGGY